MNNLERLESESVEDIVTSERHCEECGRFYKWNPAMPRWEDDKVVKYFGWQSGRCPECGAEQLSIPICGDSSQVRMTATNPTAVTWHESGELALDYASQHPRYVAVELNDPSEGLAWACTCSAPLLAVWLSRGHAKVLWFPHEHQEPNHD